MIRFSPALLVLLFPLALGAEEPKADPFKSKEGKFSVVLPGKPVEKVNKVQTDLGPLELHIFAVGQKDRTQLVTYSDFPAKKVDNAETVLKGVVEGNVKSLKGKLLSDEKAALGKAKRPGHEIRVAVPGKTPEDAGNLYRARIFLVGDRLYQVVALGPDEFIKSKTVDEYLNSFTVDE